MDIVNQGWDLDNPNVGSTDFRWWKVRPGKGLDVVILSEAPITYVGHYDKGRMQVCTGESCRMCAQNVGAQIRVAFAVAECLTKRPGLLELGRTVALELRDLADKRGALRGMRVFFTKHSGSRHSRMELELIPNESDNWWKYLPIPDVLKALQLTWEKQGSDVPQSNDTTSGQGGKPRFNRPVGDR